MSQSSSLAIRRFSIEPKDRIFVKDYGFLSVDLSINYGFIYEFIICGLWIFMPLV